MENISINIFFFYQFFVINAYIKLRGDIVASYREIVTKAVIGKGKKTFSNHYSLVPEEVPTTILGCWVINHKFRGYKNGDKIEVDGSCDVNIWYAYENDTRTYVAKETITYSELLNVTRKRESDISNEEEIIVRSLRQPTCSKVDIVDGKINYDIEKELGIEIVGDTKVRIVVDEEEDDWDEIIDETEEQALMGEIDQNVNENFISENSQE